VTALLDLGADVEWTDTEAAETARHHARPGAGRTGDLVEWLAATQGRFPPTAFKRVRCVVIGAVSDPVAELAASLGVGVRPLDPTGGFAAGASAADDEVDEGADLIVLAAHDDTAAPAVAVSVLTGAEPVALLPRGADAVDTAAWIERAVELRDTRLRTEVLRFRPDNLIEALNSPAFAATTAFAMRAAGRRTPVVLDGSVAVAAALLAYETQARAGRWWQVADTSSDPVHTRAVERLGRRPLLDLGTSTGDGSAGLLALTVLRGAAFLIGPADE
jgi:Phosphoribosyltransferase